MGILEYPYFSPGLDCPAGWNTVGVAARDADSSLSASGLLEPTTTVQSPSLIPHWENAATLFVDLLDPGETAVVCCPRYVLALSVENLGINHRTKRTTSSMTADIDFGCYSTVSEYKVSTGCYRVFPDADLDEVTKTYTVNGTTARGLVETVTGTYPITEVKTVTFDASKASSLVGISVMPVITLVHRQSDLQNAATATTTTGPAESASNAAGRVGLRLGSWDGLGAVLGLTVVAMGLGATIILA